jgi:Glycosyltransferases involved in cell wall biogenesis
MIGAVVAAALKVAREVVVVDCGSTDHTVAIVEQLGARVVHQPWLGNGFQKRIGEEACLYDILLDLDADEIVSPELADDIAEQFAAGTLAPVCALKLVTVPPVGKPWLHHAIAYRNKLYDRRVVRQPAHAVWDQFEVPKTINVRRLAAPLYHHSYRDLTQVVDKYNSYSLARSRQGKKRSRFAAGFRVIFALPVYFLKHYFQRGHYRTGIYGFSIAMIAAYGRWLSDAKTYEDHLAKADRAKAERSGHHQD